MRRIGKLYRTTLGRYPYSNKLYEVKDNFLDPRGIQTTKKQLKRLCRYKKTELNNLGYLIDLVRIDNSSRAQLVQNLEEVDPPEIVSPLGDIKKLHIEDRVLRQMLIPRRKNFKLNLRGIYTEIERHLQNREGPAKEKGAKQEAFKPKLSPEFVEFFGKIFDKVSKEMKIIQDLADNPEAAIEDVFGLIEQGKTKLGFLNVAVYRPLGDNEGRWVLTKRTRYWTEEKGLYDPKKGGRIPEGTLRSVLEGIGKIYDVDLCDLSTFEREGLKANEASIENDFRYAKGSKLSNGKESRRLLYVKIQSGDKSLFEKYGIEGVILFHNQVARDDPEYKDKDPEPLLPEEPETARRIKAILIIYVNAIVRAIETIRRREEHRKELELLAIGDSKLVYDPDRLWIDLEKSFEKSRYDFRDKVSGTKTRCEVLDLRNPHLLKDDLTFPLISCFGEISRMAWEINVGRPIPGYTHEYIVKHFLMVDRVFLTRDSNTGEIAAFSGISRLRDEETGLHVNMLEVSMIKPNYQNMRISSTLVGKLITDAFLANNLNPINVAGRTANPQVYGAMQAMKEVFPSLHNPEPTKEQQEMFKLVANFLNPYEPKNVNTFVIDDAYPMETGLIVPPHRIPSYYKNRAVERLCRERLEYDRFNRARFFEGELKETELPPIISGLKSIDRAMINVESGLPVEDEFNALLERTDLAGLLLRKYPEVSLRDYASQLIDYTKNARKDMFRALDKDYQETIRVLNRLLLEDIYASLPRRKAKAMIVTGQVTTEARRAFERREKRKKLQDMTLSLLRKVVNW